MSGVVVEIRVHDGVDVMKGDPIAVLSAMKMVSLFLSMFVRKNKGLIHTQGNGHLCPTLR
jgi:pyruvate carboxylase